MDEEKWLNVIGSDGTIDEIDNYKTETMAIQLKDLSPDDVHEPKVRIIPKKTKRNAYFVKDQSTMLSDEDMHYQMINSSDIVDKKPLLPELICSDAKIAENFDKLIKIPERFLAPKLSPYFTRNLKRINDSDVQDYQINYAEIQKSLKELQQLRKKLMTKRSLKESLQTKIRRPKTSLVENESIAEPLMCTINIQNHNHKNKNNHKENDNQTSLLKNIDLDFKPTILLGTKTYSRKKIHS
ncbi:uncharacterized protein LOC113798002 [Dermatophagoides pteronyssinus]|uniref:uncharacterized protein LOC113798002 n=1 Tax=Dermatophagoides pteronyssinus TaxID=6956 RepID=UPI003F6631ED